MAIAPATTRDQAGGRDIPSRPPRGPVVRYLVAAGVSYYGDWLTTVALVVLLYRLTGNATAPAIYILARVAPRVFGPAPGGALADRYGPARVAALCAMAQGALTAAIVVLASIRVLWGVYLAVALAQFLGSMAQPAYNAVIPHIVSREQLGRVNAIYNAILESCILVAPALGALLLLLSVTPQALILGDAASFVLAAALMLSLRTRGHGGSKDKRAGGMFAGVSIVSRDPTLRMFAVGHLCNAFVITALQAVLVVAASQRFGHDTDVGWLYAAVGAGGLLGSVALVRWAPQQVRSRGIALAVFAELIPLGLFAIAPNLAVAFALLFVSAVAAILYQTRGATALQQTVRQELLGRVNAVIRLCLYLGMFAGAVAAVSTLQWLSWDRMLALVTGIAAVVLVLAVLTQPAEPAIPEVELPGRALHPEAVRPAPRR